jgi:ABC-type nickel/cobalt efflux system permease component RcnA
MTDALMVVALGFFLGVRHAADADHVIAVTTIVARQKDLRLATLTGFLWGVGHSLTVVAAGAAIVTFNFSIGNRVSVALELSVGAMLLLLGALNVAAFTNYRPSVWRRLARRSRHVHSHAHSHGDYIHSHPHGHGPEVHPHPADRTPVSALDRRFGRWRLYQYARPVIVGVVHGLAGSAAVTLFVLTAVRETTWAIAYLIVFGIGTIAGMMFITLTLASAIRFASGRSEAMSRRFGLAAGFAAMVFGIVFAYTIWSAATS